MTAVKSSDFATATAFVSFTAVEMSAAYVCPGRSGAPVDTRMKSAFSQTYLPREVVALQP